MVGEINGERFLGCHVSCSGGLVCAAERAIALNINTIQVHPSPPQRWNGSAFAKGTEDAFLKKMECSSLRKVFFHAIYLINLANPDSRMQAMCKASLTHYLDLNARIGGEGVIFHVGSMKDEPCEDTGYIRAANAINEIMEGVPKNARLILEVSAGAGKIIGDRFEDLSAIYSKVEDKTRVGFGLDSQHMWASGYDLRANLDGVVSEIEKHFGIDKVWSIHLNDSKTELGSRKDRHENLGEGLIGLDAIKAFVNHAKLRHIPYILETPDLKDDGSSGTAVARLKALAN